MTDRLVRKPDWLQRTLEIAGKFGAGSIVAALDDRHYGRRTIHPHLGFRQAPVPDLNNRRQHARVAGPFVGVRIDLSEGGGFIDSMHETTTRSTVFDLRTDLPFEGWASLRGHRIYRQPNRARLDTALTGLRASVANSLYGWTR